MSENTPRDIPSIRKEIDQIDETLVQILNRRASLAQEIGLLKGKSDKPFFSPEREREIYRVLEQHNNGPLTNQQLRSVFREIISAARASEKPLQIAYWGPEGSYSQLAASKTFGESSGYLPTDSIQDVFLAVEHGSANYGVVPIENSVAGAVTQTLDMFPRTNVKICAELYLPIHHHLLSIASGLDKIKRVYSGPQPSAQCRHWLSQHLSGVEIIELAPTSLAAQKALSDPEGAAIANSLASEIIGIPILADHIEDDPQNRTRFIVLGFNEPPKTGADKTSIMFNLRNKPGELHRALGAFVAHDVNLLMIESRPAQRASFEYLFFMDCEGHQQDENLAKVIALLKGGYALETTILGSYPSAESML